jgi:lactoylglutathione lyase
MEVEAAKFTNYFLGFTGSSDSSGGPLRREGVVELCHNWGTESDANFTGYHNGNKAPQGFGHIAITCDDVEKTCAYLEEKQVKVYLTLFFFFNLTPPFHLFICFKNVSHRHFPLTVHMKEPA